MIDIETKVCWYCLKEESNPIHDEDAHDSCPYWCTHHSYEYEPDSRSALLTFVGNLLAEVERLRAELDHLTKNAGTDSCADYAARNAELEADAKRLRSYAAHLPACHRSLFSRPNAKCTCGLADLLLGGNA